MKTPTTQAGIRKAKWPLPIVIAAAMSTMPAHARLPHWPDTRPPGEQTWYFKGILHELGATPVTSFETLMRDPTSGVVIVLGPLGSVFERMLADNQFRQFLTRGGTVLIASDRPLSDRIAAQLGVQIHGGYRSGFPNDCYRNAYVECPLLHEFRPMGIRLTTHPVFQSLGNNPRIATNRPSYVSTPIEFPLVPLATIRTPGGRWNHDGSRRLNELPVGVVRSYAQGGRLLVLADHSLFINDMMQPTDNDNLAFAFGVLRWLLEDGRRPNVLFFDNESAQANFQMPALNPPPIQAPTPEQLIAMLNRTIRALESENAFNRALLHSIPHRNWLRGSALALTVALLAFAAHRFLHARHRFERRPKMPAKASATKVVGPASNHAEAARELALGTFEELGHRVTPAAKPPTLAVSVNGRERRQWQRRVGRLWAVAAGRTRSHSADGLRKVHAELLELRQAAAAGVVHFPAAQ